ncbi:DUF6283 family protein [Rheinheimera hassiensis]|uniref:DUF6283 family protein n=1 Tax=Rheinheimera hassiensis TaxID=1193627 RepID=UPI001F060380|nr:DUF6283 family protein [Rheinheimera hassiensis]
MSAAVRLKRVKQCAKCPWRKGVNPHDIPNGYSVEQHMALASTIADPNDVYSTLGSELRIMACHETEQAHCVGWLHNQLGAGNNIGLRLHMRNCENLGKLQVVGEQHERFESTLPK